MNKIVVILLLDRPCDSWRGVVLSCMHLWWCL